MKLKFKPIASVSALALLLTITPTAVIAQGDQNNTQSEIETTTTVQNTSTDEKPTNVEELKARLEARKTELKTRVTAARQARLKSRCKASQGKLSSISGRIKGLETSRSHVYASLADRLTKLSERLADKGLDVATLNEQITQLKTLVEAFDEDLAAYKQAIADLAEMDCVTDPTAFQASLEAARTARAEVAADAKEIRTLLKDSIKQTLKDLRSQLESTDTEETTQENQ